MTQDPAHDINHVLRVVKTARQLCHTEQAQAEVVLPAAYLHDCFAYPKDHPDRSQSSAIAADKAVSFLASAGYPSQYHQAIHHAIVAHSFSANVKPQTLEAMIVQDADRLDSLGAIGIARTMLVGGGLQRSLYLAEDPFCQSRSPDDGTYIIDHFYTKLLLLESTMNTASAKAEARIRTAWMTQYLQQLGHEIGHDNGGE
ncbi:HD domain-containing protein [Vibrio aerogenes]|nr:HD domain-containing protein [Vibrio aerogenes]